MSSTRYVVRPHHPWRERIAAAIAVAVLCVAGYVLFALGHAKGLADYLAASTDARRHAGLNQRLLEELDVLRRERDTLARSAGLDRDASEQVRRALGQQHAVLAELREELAFYRAIAVTDDRGQDLRILSFRLAPAPAYSTQHRFTLVVTRVRNDDLVTSAAVTLNVVGILRGREAHLDGDRLGGARGPKTSFQFRNFYRLEGELQLPDDFQPQQIVVQVTAMGEEGGDTTIERAFPWPLG